ncbi:MAG: hypothetical protein ACOWWM_19810 [Desulfobacterales bacterium]
MKLSDVKKTVEAWCENGLTFQCHYCGHDLVIGQDDESAVCSKCGSEYSAAEAMKSAGFIVKKDSHTAGRK